MTTPHPFGLEGLTELGIRTGADMRPTLLRVLTDLYVHRLMHTPDEERHYTELALRLLEAVDVPTRVAVARRFAGYMSPPLQVLQWLTRDLPEVRAQLRSHPLLQPSVPVERPMARSATISADEGAAPNHDAAGEAATAPLDPSIAAELNELFFAASAFERRLILLNLNIVAPISPGSIPVRRDSSVSQRLEAAALGGDREGFAQYLARTIQIPREEAKRIVHDDLGEPVVVAAKAVGMPREVLYRVLLFVNLTVGHSVERVHSLAALNDEMTQAAAEGMVAIWQALRREERLVARHQPLAWDDDIRQRARPIGTVAAPRIPLTQRTVGRRNAS